MGTVIVITSGKGGTGKTALCAALASALGEEKQRVLCLDMDIGLRNLDLALGMSDCALMDFSDVCEGRCSLSRALCQHPQAPNVFLLTAPLRLTDTQALHRQFQELVAEARERFDFVLLDAPAGLGLGFSLAVSVAQEALLVAQHDLGALRCAQCILQEISTIPKVRLIVNRLRPQTFRRLGQTVDDIMDSLGLPLLGLVPEDTAVLFAANTGQGLLCGKESPAVKAVRHIGKRLMGLSVPLTKIGRRGLFV